MRSDLNPSVPSLRSMVAARCYSSRRVQLSAWIVPWVFLFTVSMHELNLVNAEACMLQFVGCAVSPGQGHDVKCWSVAKCGETDLI